MAITSSLSDDKNSLIIKIEGRFDFNALQEFRKSYEKHGKQTSYVLDLEEAEYLDSSALGMLLALRDYAGGDKADVKIINAIPDVKKILTITKLDELFKIE